MRFIFKDMGKQCVHNLVTQLIGNNSHICQLKAYEFAKF